MLKKFKHTIKHTSIYSFGNISIKIIGLLLLPLYTSRLSLEEYGVITTLEIINQIIATVFGLHLSQAMIRWYAEEKDEFSQHRIIRTTYIFILFIALIFLALSLSFPKTLSQLLLSESSFHLYISLTCIWSTLEIINRTTFDLFRIKERSLYYTKLLIIRFILFLALNIFFIAYLDMGITGFLWSNIIGNIFYLVVTLPFIFQSLNKVKADFTMIPAMLRYSIPLVITSLTSLILTMSDRFILLKLENMEVVGIYNLAYKIASVINMFVIQAFIFGFFPIALKIIEKPDAKKFLARLMTYFTILLFISALGLSSFSKEVVYFFSKSNNNYWEASYLVPLLSFNFIIRGIALLIGLSFLYVKKPAPNVYIIITASIINIALNFLFIPYFSYFGAATATVISNIIILVISFILTQKIFHIPYEYIRVAKVFCVGSLILISITALDSYFDISFHLFLYKILLLISFPLLLWATDFLYLSEKKSFKGFWHKWKNPKNIKQNITDLLNQKNE